MNQFFTNVSIVMNKKIWLILFMSLLVSVSLASYIERSLDDIIKESDLIVIGKIDSIKFAEPAFDKNNQPIPTWKLPDTGYITVKEIMYENLSNIDSSTQVIPLIMSSATSKSPNDYDRRFELGIEGIWILKYNKNSFQVSHPVEFQKLAAEKQVRGIIQKLKTNSTRTNIENEK